MLTCFGRSFATVVERDRTRLFRSFIFHISNGKILIQPKTNRIWILLLQFRYMLLVFQWTEKIKKKQNKLICQTELSKSTFKTALVFVFYFGSICCVHIDSESFIHFCIMKKQTESFIQSLACYDAYVLMVTADLILLPVRRKQEKKIRI